MKKSDIIDYTFYLIAAALFAVSIIAILCGDGDKGLISLF
jgi:hypothetical protein